MAAFNEVQPNNTVADFASVLERSFSPQTDSTLRVPFYLTSTYRQKKNLPGVSMLMNPQTVSFRKAKRITRKDTQAGAVFYHWANRGGRNNDILEMDCSGQTGNINIRAGAVQRGSIPFKKNDTQIPTDRGPLAFLNNIAKSNTDVQGLQSLVRTQGDDYTASGVSKMANFFNLYSLTREPMHDPRTGEPVYYYISYSSPLFGNTFVTFIGHFNRVMDFTEDASDPFNVKYSFGFTALSSSPSMDSIYQTVTQNLSYLFSNPIDKG